MAGALGSFLSCGDEEYAKKVVEAIDAELTREMVEFIYALNNPVQEIDLLRLASSLTHNCGDLDQGISYWPGTRMHNTYRLRFGRLAHDNTQPYGGVYQVAAKLYKNLLSAEGHRHYPLRNARCLRASPDFLLPVSPFFDDWGARIAQHPTLLISERAEVLSALLLGCKKIKRQVGYYRAISGFVRGTTELRKIIASMSNSMRREFNDPVVKQQIELSKYSYEASMRKQARQLLVDC